MKNEGTVDRVIRAIVGIAVIAVIAVGYFSVSGPAQWIAMCIGLVIEGTAIFGYCHLYKILGVNTLNKK